MVKVETKAAVLTELAEQARIAKKRGQNAYSLLRVQNPDVPESIIAEAWTQMESDEEEAWWDSIEKTIDGELVKRAISGQI